MNWMPTFAPRLRKIPLRLEKRTQAWREKSARCGPGRRERRVRGVRLSEGRSCRYGARTATVMGAMGERAVRGGQKAGS